MLTLLVLTAVIVAAPMLGTGAVIVLDRVLEHIADRHFRGAGVRWVPPVHRSRRARRALRDLPITSPDADPRPPYDLWS